MLLYNAPSTKIDPSWDKLLKSMLVGSQCWWTGTWENTAANGSGGREYQMEKLWYTRMSYPFTK